MCARDFDGVDDIISQGSITAFAGSWTMVAWINADSAGESGNGRIILTNTASVRERSLWFQTGMNFRSLQKFSTTDATSVSSNTLAVGTWYCVATTYNSADMIMRLYYGSLAAAMVEASYGTQTAGVGTPNEGSTRVHAGNRPDQAETFDGRIAHACVDNRIWTLDEMEAFRQGQRPINTGSMIVYWPLDSPTAAQAEDLSGNNYHGTVTGALAAEGPPVAMRWGDSFGMTYTTAAAAAKVPVFMHSYRRRRAA